MTTPPEHEFTFTQAALLILLFAIAAAYYLAPVIEAIRSKP